MRFSRLRIDGRVTLVLQSEGRYVSVDDLLRRQRGSTDLNYIFDKLPEVEKELKRGSYSYLDPNSFGFAPAVGDPGKIICVGLNYRSHVEETERKVPEHPILFSKYSNALAGHLDNIVIPERDLKVDYEGELGVMVGKKARNVGNDFGDYIFGYFVGNDVSSRELQYRSSQYLLGKTLDGFYPNGPLLVTKDEVDDPQNLRIMTKVNGELRQDSNTKNMIFSVGTLVSYISRYLTLQPGDIISTGTPEGVVLGMKDKESHWLKPGDTTEVSIEGIGALKNGFV